MSEKLVRDKIPEFSQLAKDGRIFRTASREELPTFFARKMVEEAQETAEELLQKHVSTEKLMEELVDCLEVIEAIKKHFCITDSFLNDVRRKKAAKKGTFESQVILDLSTNIPRL